jgi:hypothetical protein
MISSVSGAGSFFLAAVQPARPAADIAVSAAPGTTRMVAPVQPVAPIAPPVGRLVTGEALAELQGANFDFAAERERLAAAKAAGAYGLASMPEVPTLRPVPPKTPLREVGALGFIPGDVLHGGGARGLIDHVRSQLAEIRDLARREAEISERLGEPVKIAFDPNSGHTVVLTRADADYARVRSAAEVYDRVKFDLQKMGLSLADFRDLLQA